MGGRRDSSKRLRRRQLPLAAQRERITEIFTYILWVLYWTFGCHETGPVTKIACPAFGAGPLRRGLALNRAGEKFALHLYPYIRQSGALSLRYRRKGGLFPSFLQSFQVFRDHWLVPLELEPLFVVG